MGWSQAFPSAVPSWSQPILAGLLALVLALAARSFMAGVRARRLERQRNLLADDVCVLQRALVPDLPERVGDLSVSAAYRPAEDAAAGGDFYDVFELADGRVGLILGDVSGHGRDALERATLMRYTIRAYVEAGLEPRAALKLAGSTLGEPSEDGFVTAAVAVFDMQAGLVTYSLAGHHRPLLLGFGLPEPVQILASPPLGLGLPTGLRQTSLSLSHDAVVCFFTDGLVEARVGGDMLGRETLERLLSMVGPGPGAAALLNRTVEHAVDDMAVCIVRPIAAVRAEPLHLEELELGPCACDARELARFLVACGVAPAEISSAIDAVEGAGVEPSRALVRVRIEEFASSVAVEQLDPESLGLSSLAL